MELLPEISVEVSPELLSAPKDGYDFDRIIFDLNSKIEDLSSHADTLDCMVAAASGILCGALDVLWVGGFDLREGRNLTDEKTNEFVLKIARAFGYEGDDLGKAVETLEKRFPIPSDGNTPGFGGGLQHHLRDFAHHPTIVGLVFSLLTQFTEKAYGTDTAGRFLVLDVPEKSLAFIGKDVPSKILYGTVIWFFHLVSDIAGSKDTAGGSGGTGIPGPILSLAKEISAIPIFKNLTIQDNTVSVLLSKLFNGTLLAQHDENGKILKDTVLKFDFRGELGAGVELGKQAIPVVANECIVRAFYFIRRLTVELKQLKPRSIDDFKQIHWEKVKPAGNPTIARMLTIATGVFTTVDIGEAVVSQKYWVNINYVGVGRFAIAVGEDVSWCLKSRKVKEVREMYETIQRNVFSRSDANMYERIGRNMDVDRLGLTLEETEILYNLEYFKVLNDIESTKVPIRNTRIKSLKQDWLTEWQQFISLGYESFTQVSGAEMHWYSKEELIQHIEENDPTKTWFRLILLEVMLFEPYYPLGTETDKKGNEIPSKKYKDIQGPIVGYSSSNADKYLDSFFEGPYYQTGYIKRLRKCYASVTRELNEVLKAVITSLAVTAAIAIVVIATAGALAPEIAVALVGSNFAGLSGAALTSASLAYLGGGAIAVGGAGMAGGTIAIVGGGAALGLGVGAGVGGAVGAVSVTGKKNTILQSAKLMVSVREIFLNDEHDTEYSNSILEQYVQNIAEIEKGLVDLRLKADIATGKEKKELKEQIKRAEESVDAMKLARKSMAKFVSSFEIGLAQS